jgi:hypothetical protein
MAYRLPDFNLVVKLWRVPNQVFLAADMTFFGNLAYARRQAFRDFNPNPIGSTTNLDLGGMYLLCPKQTDIRGGCVNYYTDVVEVPSGTGRFYLVRTVDDAGKGFANEHRVAELSQFDGTTATNTGNSWAVPAWPYPTP